MDGWASDYNSEPMGEPHDIILHVRMLDRDNRLQQDAIGRLGVNIVYGAFHFGTSHQFLYAGLLDEIGS